jgi:hypothetical protein
MNNIYFCNACIRVYIDDYCKNLEKDIDIEMRAKRRIYASIYSITYRTSWTLNGDDNIVINEFPHFMTKYLVDLTRILEFLDVNNIKWENKTLTFDECDPTAEILRKGKLIIDDNLVTVIYIDKSGEEEIKEYMINKNKNKII